MLRKQLMCHQFCYKPITNDTLGKDIKNIYLKCILDISRSLGPSNVFRSIQWVLKLFVYLTQGLQCSTFHWTFYKPSPSTTYWTTTLPQIFFLLPCLLNSQMFFRTFNDWTNFLHTSPKFMVWITYWET